MTESAKAGQYVVLRKNPVTGEWTELGIGEGIQKVVKATDGATLDGYTYVQVPLRSFNPIEFEVEEIVRARVVGKRVEQEPEPVAAA